MKQVNLLDTLSLDGFYLTQEYGTNKYYDYTKFGLLFHEGVDCSHSNKTKEIRCVHGGECLKGYDSAYGNYVIVLDYSQSCATWYCHLSNIAVESGQERKAGDVIGRMGNSGNSSGAHLHFNFVFINPDGSRMYKNKEHNRGFLDPCHPLDPSVSKKLGIDYNISWRKNEETMDNCQEIFNHFGVKDFEDLKRWKKQEEGFLKDERAKVKFMESKIKMLEDQAEIKKNEFILLLETSEDINARNTELSSEVDYLSSNLTHEKEKNDSLSRKIMNLTEEITKLNTKLQGLETKACASVSLWTFIVNKIFKN